MTGLNETPSGSRLNIGVFGRANSGKSSFINALSGQEVSIVSELAGTTTDPVYKAIELHPLGPCLLMDTAGSGDGSSLSQKRMEKTFLAAQRADLAVIVFDASDLGNGAQGELAQMEGQDWYRQLSERGVPRLYVINKADSYPEQARLGRKFLEERQGGEIMCLSCRQNKGEYGFDRETVIAALAGLLPKEEERSLVGSMVSREDLVLLVMPQDIQAPKGRLILPQVQTIRELLDRCCTVVCVTREGLVPALKQLKKAPRLIITDSQVFDYVYENKPEESLLTSFSVLMASLKGDRDYYLKGAEAIGKLNAGSRVLIAECCSHAPLSEDIGRVKIPAMLRKRAGEALQIEVVSGQDFPEKLGDYDLIIQCGACMFNRAHVLSRIQRAKQAGVPMTNYGMAIARLKGILDKVEIP